MALPNRLYPLELRHARATKQRKPKTKAIAITRFKVNFNSKFYMEPMKALLSFSRSRILTWPIIIESYQPKTWMNIKFLESRRKSKKITKQEEVQRLHKTYKSSNR